MDEIKKWLVDENGTFEEGYALLMARSRNRHILQYLGRKRDMPKLRYELGKFVSGSESEELENKEPEKRKELAPVKSVAPELEPLQKPYERLKIINDGAIMYRDLPDVLKPVYESTFEIYRQMRSAHEALKIAPTDEARQEIRTTLLNLDEQRKTAWTAIDMWASTGQFPEWIESWEDQNKKEIENADSDYKTVAAARVAVTRYIGELKAEPEMDPAKRAELIEKARHAVSVVTSAGGKFDKLLEPLRKYGIITS